MHFKIGDKLKEGDLSDFCGATEDFYDSGIKKNDTLYTQKLR